MEAEPQFNISALLTINYDFDQLQKVIEYLLKRDKENKEIISKLGADLGSAQKNFKDFKITGGGSGSTPAASHTDLSEIIEKLAKLEEKVHSHEEKIAQQQTAIDTTKESLDSAQSTIINHENRITDLEKLKEEMENILKKMAELEKSLKSVQKTKEPTKQTAKEVEPSIPTVKEVEPIKPTMKEIEPQSSSDKAEYSHKGGKGEKGAKGVKGDDVDYSRVEGLIAQLKGEMMGSLVRREDFDSLTKRVQELESVAKQLNQAQEETKSRVSGIDKQTGENTEEIKMLKECIKQTDEKIADKVSCEDYDKLVAIINNLKTSPGDISKPMLPSEPGLSTKDMNFLKDIKNKLPDIESRLDDLYKLFKSLNIRGVEDKIKDIYDKLEKKAEKTDISSLQKELELLKEQLEKLQEIINLVAGETKTNKEDIAKLKSRLDLLETKVTHLTKTIGELVLKIEKAPKKEADRSKEQNLAAQNAGARVDEEEWAEMKKAIEKIRGNIVDIYNEFDLLKDLRKKLSLVESIIETKLDKDEFEKWKQSNDINLLMSTLTKRFADRSEYLKTIKKLEARILVLEENTVHEGSGELGDNPMLAKKPLGGWSCASCQKDLVNIEGMRVAYQPWAKLPQRNPAERIAKVGHGFSRMLAMLKPELIEKSQNIDVIHSRRLNESQHLASEEESKALSLTHGAGFIAKEEDRPESAHLLPSIQKAKKDK